MRQLLLGCGLAVVLSTRAFATDVSGTIAANTTWTLAASPYVVTSTVTVSNGATLTIEPGVVVRFRSATGLTIGSTTLGTLVAVGTPASPITFRADIPFPSPGYWNGILFAATTAGSILEHCAVNDAGAGTNDAAIRIQSSTPTVRDTAILRTDGFGMFITSAAGRCTIEDVAFELGTTYPLHADFPAWPAQLSGLSFASNGIEGIEVGAGTLAGDGRFADHGVPYALIGALNVMGASAPTLTVDPGVVLRFRTAASLAVGASALGRLDAQGTARSPILLTSDAASPAPGDWSGLRINDFALASSVLRHCTIEYAGRTNTPSLDLASSDPTVADVLVRSAAWDGISVNASAATLTDVTIDGTGRYGLIVQGNASATIDRLSVLNPTLHGVSVSTTTASGSLTDSVIANSIQFTGVTSMVVSGNTFTNYDPFPARLEANSVGDFVADNSFQGVVPGSSRLEVTADTISQSATWPNLGIDYVLLGAVTVAGSTRPTLTLAPGVRLRLNTGIALTVGSGQPGALQAVGTASEPITFTSNAAIPAAGTWSSVRFESLALPSSTLDRCVIEYGASSDSALYVNISIPTLRNLVVRDSLFDGVRLRGGTSVTFEDSVIERTGRYGVFVDGATTATVRNVVIDDPTNYGFYVSSTTAGGVLEDSDVEHGIYFTGNSTMSVLGNTFRDYAAFPTRIAADRCGEFLAGNTVLDIDAGLSPLELLAGTLTRSALWPNIGVVYTALGTIGISGAAAPVLTLEPGVVLRFPASASLTVGSNSASTPGGLIAVGSPAAPITFTSTSSTPAAGAWARVLFDDSTVPGSILERCVVEYAGNSAANPGINIDVSSPTLSDVVVRHSAFDGMILNGATQAALQRVTVQDCGRYGAQFTGATAASVNRLHVSATGNYGVFVNSTTSQGLLASSTIDKGIFFTGPSSMSVVRNTFSDYHAFPTRLAADRVEEFLAHNTLIGVNPGSSVLEILAGTLAPSASWPNVGLVYSVLGNLIVSSSTGTTLTLAAGCELRFAANSVLQVGATNAPGTLVAAGTPLLPLVFGAASGAPGGWNGILFQNTTPNSLLEHCIVRHGGQTANTANVRCVSSSPRIVASTIANSLRAGIIVSGGAPLIEANTITANDTGVSLSGSASAATRLSNNDIAGNATSGLSSTIVTGMDARANWWGQASGPASIGSGTGDAIVGSVLFEPWLGGPADADRIWRTAAGGPDPFSQLGGSITVAAETSVAAAWLVEFLDAGASVVRTFSGNGAQILVDWDGHDALDAPAANGIYTYRVSATAGSAFPVLVGDVTLDDTLLVAKIDLPDPQQIIGGSLAISGSASGAGFANYQLQFGAGYTPTAWTTISSSTTPVVGGPLGTWNIATNLINPVYTVRLIVTDTGAVTVEDRVATRLLKILTLSHTPATFSPNDDGIQESVTVNATLTVPVAWTLEFRSGAVPVRTVSGFADAISFAWDGRDDSALVLPDGNYDYTLSAADGSGTVMASSVSSSAIRLDNTAPTIAITAPTRAGTILSNENFTVLGQATDANFTNYNLAVGSGSPAATFTTIASGTTQISGVPPADVLGTWIVANYAPGPYTLRLTATDGGGNVSVLDRAVSVDYIEVTNVFAEPPVLDIAAGDTGTVYFTIDRPADVEARIYAWPGTALVRTIQLTGLPAGDNSFTWDGRDQGGLFSSIGQANFVTLTASDVAGREGVFNSPTSPLMTPVGAWGPTNVVTAGFDPYRNDEIDVIYTVNSWLRSNITVQGSGLSRPLSVHGVFPPGDHVDYWDGRNQSGNIHTGAFSFYFGVPGAVPSSAFYIQRLPLRFADFRAQAYVIHPTFGEISTFEFDLSEPAVVTIAITDPNGNHARSLYASRSLAAGPHAVEWDGRNDAGAIVSVEGHYRIVMTATDPFTGVTSQRIGSITVYR